MRYRAASRTVRYLYRGSSSVAPRMYKSTLRATETTGSLTSLDVAALPSSLQKRSYPMLNAVLSATSFRSLYNPWLSMPDMMRRIRRELSSSSSAHDCELSRCPRISQAVPMRISSVCTRSLLQIRCISGISSSCMEAGISCQHSPIRYGR